MAEALGGLRRFSAHKCVFDATAAPAMLGPGEMDARTAELPVISQQQSWLQRERASGRFYDRAAVLIGLFLVAMLGLSAWLLTRNVEPGTLLSPPLIAVLLIAILLPAIALMALYARRVAVRRAEQGGLGSGRLHIRLVRCSRQSRPFRRFSSRYSRRFCSRAGSSSGFPIAPGRCSRNSVQLARTTYRKPKSSELPLNTLTASGDLARLT